MVDSCEVDRSVLAEGSSWVRVLEVEAAKMAGRLMEDPGFTGCECGLGGRGGNVTFWE